ncbi:hypothetical protein [Brumimicrobium glaciale]|jgi:hypothetical protein|uniref:hypothetical protein n=1 Tax=Brumimicrobium glaciale TaxID=200475 RepID=UPI0013ED34E2|nr:hypothetical protein [Brumimicrobium glaciale]
MEQEKQIRKSQKAISMSKATKERLAKVALELKGKELFPQKVEQAKRTLSKIKSLPI